MVCIFFDYLHYAYYIPELLFIVYKSFSLIYRDLESLDPETINEKINNFDFFDFLIKSIRLPSNEYCKEFSLFLPRFLIKGVKFRTYRSLFSLQDFLERDKPNWGNKLGHLFRLQTYLVQANIIDFSETFFFDALLYLPYLSYSEKKYMTLFSIQPSIYLNLAYLFMKYIQTQFLSDKYSSDKFFVPGCPTKAHDNFLDNYTISLDEYTSSSNESNDLHNESNEFDNTINNSKNKYFIFNFVKSIIEISQEIKDMFSKEQTQNLIAFYNYCINDLNITIKVDDEQEYDINQQDDCNLHDYNDEEGCNDGYEDNDDNNDNNNNYDSDYNDNDNYEDMDNQQDSSFNFLPKKYKAIQNGSQASSLNYK